MMAVRLWRYTNPLLRATMRLRATWAMFWCCCLAAKAQAQCAGQAGTPQAASDCAAQSQPSNSLMPLDPAHTYSLAELIDLAEHNNPRTRIFWERAKQSADRLGIEKSAYFPVLAGIAAVANERIIEPFPRPLGAPKGYTVITATQIQPELTLDYCYSILAAAPQGSIRRRRRNSRPERASFERTRRWRMEWLPATTN